VSDVSARILARKSASWNASLIGVLYADQVHKDGRSAIHHAAIYGVVDTVELLLRRGVAADTPTADGKTPILLAAVEGHADIVRLLVRHGCDVNRVYEDAMTPLSAAASGQHLAAVNGPSSARVARCLYLHASSIADRWRLLLCRGG